MEERFLILLVDDSKENLDFLNQALRDSYDVIIARDGFQSLRVIEKRKPHLILLDIVMPGMDGYEVCTALKKDDRTREIPVIFLTGLANQIDKSRGFNLGAVDYITKPFNIVEVKARVKNQLIISQARQLLEQQNRRLEDEVNRRMEQLNRTRENLVATEDKFRLLFQRSVNAIAFCHPLTDERGEFVDYIYQDVNANFEKITGIPRDKLLGRRESELFPREDPHWLAVLGKSVNENLATPFETYHKGMDKYLLGSGFTISPHDSAFAIVLNDITERTLYQNQLIHAKEQAEESDRLKSAFLTNISHEIRTPLNGIIGFSQLMKQESISSGTKEHYIKIIEKCSHNLINVIDEIIEFSHIESSSHPLSYTKINLNRFLENRLSALREERDRAGKHNIEMVSQFTLEDGDDGFVTDRERLKRILDNLLSNALKYTEQGSVTLGYRMGKAREKLTLYVRDTGRGIGQQKKQIIFKSFRQAEEGYSREFGGMGLGLAITKKITGQLGGEINVMSRLGKGSHFSVILPYRTDLPSRDPLLEHAVDTGDLLRGQWVLILDRHMYTRETLIRLLRLKEMNWLHVSNLDEAQRACREHPDIDTVLINRDSLEEAPHDVPRSIKSFRSGLNCLLFGEPSLKEEESELREAGYDDILYRPLEPRTLYQALIRGGERHG